MGNPIARGQEPAVERDAVLRLEPDILPYGIVRSGDWNVILRRVEKRGTAPRCRENENKDRKKRAAAEASGERPCIRYGHRDPIFPHSTSSPPYPGATIPVDLSAMGMGKQTVGFVLDNALLGHAYCHCGEISAAKGIQGKKGYPY
jgi:hypothetical protein